MCWKSMLEAAFKGTSIKTARGETASDAFKFDKLLNESEFGSSKESIMGRRLDMKTVFYLIDDSNNKQQQATC
ncbi:hypothetical protein RMCBS344292_06912 [Rhizopus microsporus]|nr:hypothetical protein RMCBS344292_06912 [Rhizopus microsporus]